jgi:hypothetical protein
MWYYIITKQSGSEKLSGCFSMPRNGGEHMAKDFARSFYKSKAWRNARAYVLRRDLFSCHDCGCRATEVHHLTELNPDNINDPAISLNPDNLVSLCSVCHKKRTLGKGDVADGLEFDENGQVVKAN